MGSIEIGSVVQLRTGGTRMTVEAISKGLFSVVWFDGFTLKREDLPSETLMLAPDEK